MDTENVQSCPLQASRGRTWSKKCKDPAVEMVVKCRTLSRSRVVTGVHSCREKCRRGRTASLKMGRRKIHVLMRLWAHHLAPSNMERSWMPPMGYNPRPVSLSRVLALAPVPRRCEALSEILWQKKHNPVSNARSSNLLSVDWAEVLPGGRGCVKRETSGFSESQSWIGSPCQSHPPTQSLTPTQEMRLPAAFTRARWSSCCWSGGPTIGSCGRGWGRGGCPCGSCGPSHPRAGPGRSRCGRACRR